MSVTRLSLDGLRKILKGKVRDPITCVVKFYSNGCHYCHALRDYYEEIAQSNPDLYFFAFNTEDTENLDKYIKMNGVPTIVVVKTGGHRPKVSMLADPGKPHEKTWYWANDIQQFIDENR